MKMDINPKLELGTYQIACSKCGYLLYNPMDGDRTIAALKAMELYPEGIICPNCGGEVIIEINPAEKTNKYSAEHPYYP